MEKVLKRIWQISLIFITLMSCLMLTSCGGDEEQEAQTEEEKLQVDIRGYWICEEKDLAMEIVALSSLLQGYDNPPTDNGFRLWYIGGSSPQCYEWKSQGLSTGYNRTINGPFHFSDPDYSWQDKVYIALYLGDELYLEGLDMYCFRRVSQQYFDDIVNRSGGNSDGGSGGNTGGGDNSGGGGGSSDHHYPCKSCDETGDCDHCFGTGVDIITGRKCNYCHGTGDCQICHGKGYIIV